MFSSTDLTYIADLVHRRASIVLDASKEYLITARLAPVVRHTSTGSLEGLVRELRRAAWGPLHEQVVEALTTNETSFFRDFHPWEAMRTAVIPELIEARQSSRHLSVWCAASSSGQEPYTIAMVLREHFPELAGWSVRIAATDLSREMVGRTTQGWYSELDVNRGLSPALRARYFESVDGGWRANADLRRFVTPRRLNLADPWPDLGPIDLVFMRNVLIYFDVATRRQILERVALLLPSDGALFLGAAETTVNITNSFTRVSIGATSVYRPTRSQPNSPVAGTGAPRVKIGAA